MILTVSSIMLVSAARCMKFASYLGTTYVCLGQVWSGVIAGFEETIPTCTRDNKRRPKLLSLGLDHVNIDFAAMDFKASFPSLQNCPPLSLLWSLHHVWQCLWCLKCIFSLSFLYTIPQAIEASTHVLAILWSHVWLLCWLLTIICPIAPITWFPSHSHSLLYTFGHWSTSYPHSSAITSANFLLALIHPSMLAMLDWSSMVLRMSTGEKWHGWRWQI
jgi:hypothetical protein